MGKFGLAYDLNKKTRRQGVEWTPEECQEQIDGFHRQYPELSAWLKLQQNRGKRLGYIDTIFGRRRPLPGFASSEWKDKKKALNEAINTPVQSTASDVFLLGAKCARDRLDRRVSKILAAVHDALVIEVRDDYLEEAMAITINSMENPTLNGRPLDFLTIPMVAEGGSGKSYGRIE